METIYNWTIMKNNTVFGYAQGSRGLGEWYYI